LKEKTNMVMETDFELYTEASINSAPYYGAKFEPRGGAYIGSVPENAEKLLPLSAYLTYVEDMYQTDFYYPANEMIKSDNVITMVGWTIHDMSNVDYAQVKNTLEKLNRYNKPIFIRFANEMNCSSLGDDPERYVEIFRTVADMIHEYPNFAVVWSPNDMGALDRPFEYFYPGNEYVDWIGISSYMIKYFQGNQNTAYKDSVYFMTGDYSWPTNRIKPLIEFMENNGINKPIMISEGGVATNNSYGEDCSSWASPRLRNMFWYLTMKYPQVKMINYFNTHRSNETEKFDISDYSYAVDIFNEAKNNGSYITEYGKDAEFVFGRANDAGTLKAENGKIPLYTLAYIPNQPDIIVNYSIDGNWYHSSAQIPYTCDMDITNLTDGSHTVKISTLDKEKEYTFYKKGQYISFGKEPEVEISVNVNGSQITFDQPPVMQNNRTLVPLRAIFEALGAKVDWNGETQTVTAVKDNTTIKLTIGSDILYVDKDEVKLDVPAQILN
ncbi:MAG: hypothetical protein IJX57_05635, partial [Clostridia bacterium]|nr:hypothetical protein [Clostridia bacterium]